MAVDKWYAIRRLNFYHSRLVTCVTMGQMHQCSENTDNAT